MGMKNKDLVHSLFIWPTNIYLVAIFFIRYYIKSKDTIANKTMKEKW